MIPAPPGIFDEASGKQVVAFDDEGAALILGKKSPSLQHASGPIVREDTFVNTVPAGGFRVKIEYTDGSAEDKPLICWQVNRIGYLTAAFLDTDGSITTTSELWDDEGIKGTVVVYHPSCTETPATTDQGE